MAGGLFGACRNLVRAILSPIFSYRRFIHYEPDPGFAPTEKPHPEVNIRQLGVEHMEQIANFYNTQENSEKHVIIADRFRNGADCFAVFYNDWIISMAWGLYNDDEEKDSGLKLTPESKQVILSDVLTADLFSDKEIQTHLMAHLFNTYKEKGVKIRGAVECNNEMLLQAVKKLKCKFIGSKLSLKLFGLRIF